MSSFIVDLFVEMRKIARQHRDYTLADDMRDFLLLCGVKIRDYEWGSLWI